MSERINPEELLLYVLRYLHIGWKNGKLEISILLEFFMTIKKRWPSLGSAFSPLNKLGLKSA